LTESKECELKLYSELRKRIEKDLNYNNKNLKYSQRSKRRRSRAERMSSRCGSSKAESVEKNGIWSSQENGMTPVVLAKHKPSDGSCTPTLKYDPSLKDTPWKL